MGNMTKIHYQRLVEALDEIPPSLNRDRFVDWLVGILTEENPAFQEETFRQALAERAGESTS